MGGTSANSANSAVPARSPTAAPPAARRRTCEKRSSERHSLHREGRYQRGPGQQERRSGRRRPPRPAPSSARRSGSDSESSSKTGRQRAEDDAASATPASASSAGSPCVPEANASGGTSSARTCAAARREKAERAEAREAVRSPHGDQCERRHLGEPGGHEPGPVQQESREHCDRGEAGPVEQRARGGMDRRRQPSGDETAGREQRDATAPAAVTEALPSIRAPARPGQAWAGAPAPGDRRHRPHQQALVPRMGAGVESAHQDRETDSGAPQPIVSAGRRRSGRRPRPR